MGYSGLDRALESDTAADLFADLVDAIAERLEKEVDSWGNGYNTDGCVNVAFVFDEMLNRVKSKSIFLGIYKILEVAKRCVENLDKLIEEAKKADGWDDKANQQYHLKHYRRLRNSVQRFIDKVSEE